MGHRSRRAVAFSACLALAVLTVPALPSRALYQVHETIVSEDPADTTPQVIENAEFPPFAGEAKTKVTAIVPLGGRVYVGGTFTGVRNAGTSAKLSRPGLFAIDAQTHLVDPTFDPVLDGAVEAMAPSPDGTAIFVAGKFGTVDGQAVSRLAKLDAVTGAPVPGFNPRPNAEVKDIVVAGDRLFLAGPFSAVAEQPRAGLAAVDLVTGSLDPDVAVPFSDPRQGTARVESLAITPDGTTLAAGGNFTKAGGLERWQVALLDVTPDRVATVLDWHTDRFNDTVVTSNPGDVPACAGGGVGGFDAHIKDMDMSPDGRYFVVVTTGGYTKRGPLCDTASRWETSARGQHLQPTWANYDGGDTYTGVAISGTAVYVGGHMRWMNNYNNKGSADDALPGEGSVEREGLAALDPASGLPLPWNPRRERGHGPEAMVTTADGLWVGNDTDFVGHRDFDGSPRRGEHHQKLAFFPLAGGKAVPRISAQGLPTDLYRVAGGGVTRQHFDGSQLGQAVTVDTGFDWSGVRAAFTTDGLLYTGTKDGRLLRRSFDGSSFGPPAEVDLRGMGTSHLPIKNMTGMFFDDGRIYFTVAGVKELQYRSFLSQPDVRDDIVGDNQPYQVLDRAGMDWSTVDTMTYADGHIYFTRGGDLHRVAFRDRKVSGAPSVVATGFGDAATLFLRPKAATPLPPAPPAPAPQDPGPSGPSGPNATGRSGYWMVGEDGAVYAFGAAGHLGDATRLLGTAKAVDLEPTPSYGGYWIVDDTGRVFSFGDARHFGNAERGRLVAGEQVTSLSATPSGAGYWIFTNRGRVLALGDARHAGDLAAIKLNGPVLDSIPTPSGLGYYMVGSDGGIFAFGDAVFHGSMGGVRLNQPVQSLVPDGDGRGYWLVASDGGVFAFDAPFRGSMGHTRLNRPMTGMVPFGNGYLMVGADGGIFNFSDREFFGSLGANPPSRPIVAVAALNG